MEVFVRQISLEAPIKFEERIRGAEFVSLRIGGTRLKIFLPIKGGSLNVGNSPFVGAGEEYEVCWEHLFDFHEANIAYQNLTPLYPLLVAAPNDGGPLFVVESLVRLIPLIIFIACITKM